MDESEDQFLMVAWTTLPSEAAAVSMAKLLVSSGLVACVQIDGQIRSFYRWKGEICDDPEWRLSLKFLGCREAQVKAICLEAHPYDVPQWIACWLDRVDEAYGSWARSSCEGAQ